MRERNRERERSVTEPEPEPGATEATASPVPAIDPALVDALAELDREVSGEIKFCRQTSDALFAFQARWAADLPVADGYGKAIQAMDTLVSILTGAAVRTSENVTRMVLGHQQAEQQAHAAEVARDHAIAWAETPPPAGTLEPAPASPPALSASSAAGSEL